MRSTRDLAEELRKQIRALEETWDGEESGSPAGTTGLSLGPLPSGDELAAEVERFLRDQGR